MIARTIVVAAAAAVFGFGVLRGTWAVGGSDSSCYGLMAEAFARGRLQPTSQLATEAPWPSAPLTLAPGGFIPSPERRDAASPVCAPGFSLLLAPFRALGGPDGIFLVTPLAGAGLAWLTFVFGRRLAGPVVGAAASIVMAATPVFLFQVVQPMNDVVVAMLWMAIFVAACRPQPPPAAIGALTGLALLVRPNLAPAAVVLALFVAGVPTFSADAFKRVTRFGFAALPCVAAAMALNAVLYGHPLQTGYGSAADLFAASHVGTNLRQFGIALVQTQLAFPLLAMASPLIAPTAARREVLLVLVVTLPMIVLYLFYKPFPEWWYLRFLLPTLAPLTVLATSFVWWASRSSVVVVGCAAIVAGFGIHTARDRQALDLWRLESRIRSAGTVARDRLPPNAVVITVWESGTVKYHAGREAVLWDSLEPGALDSALTWLSERGREPFIMVEQWEEGAFRARFAGHSTFGDLDWPPRYEIERQVKVFSPQDRAIYLGGGFVPTERVVR